MGERGSGSGDLPAGTLLAGRYRIERLLGRGGMGAVYEATHVELSRKVALKVLDSARDAADDAIAATEREARAAAQLAHPHIVPVTDFFRQPGEPPFLVMELLQGESLAERLARLHTLAPDAAVFIAVQVLSALAAAHEAGLVHRDVKPANVFLTRTAATNDFVRLLDFGVAWNTYAAVSRRGQASAGTPAYMAPEQISGEGIDARADLWAVGVCLFEMLTGQLPFAAANDAALLVRICKEDPPAVDEVAPNAGRELGRIVARALSKDPAQRFESAEAMRAALAPLARAAAVPSRALGAASEAGGAIDALAAAETVRAGSDDASSTLGGAPRTTVDAAVLATTKTRPSAPAAPTLASRPSAGKPALGRPRGLRGPLALGLLVAGGVVATAIGLRAGRPRGSSTAASASASAAARSCRIVRTQELGTLSGDQIDLAGQKGDAVVTIDEAAGAPSVFRRLPSGDGFERWIPTPIVQEVLGRAKGMRSCAGAATDGELALTAIQPQKGRSVLTLFALTSTDGGLGMPKGGVVSPVRHLSSRIRCAHFQGTTALLSLGDDAEPDEPGLVPGLLRLFVLNEGTRPESHSLMRTELVDFDVAIGAERVALATVSTTNLLVMVTPTSKIAFTAAFHADNAEPGASIAHSGGRFFVVWRQKPALTLWAELSRTGAYVARGSLLEGDVVLPTIAARGEDVLLAFGRPEGRAVRLYVGAGANAKEAAAHAAVVATAEKPTQLRLASGASPWLAWVDDAGGRRAVRLAALDCP